MADVFVSYARADMARVKPLVQLVERQGWSVFWDTRLVPGDQWRQHLLQELQACTTCVVVWSTASVASEWVAEETALAKARKILVPVMIDAIEIPLGFRSAQAANLIAWQPGDRSHDQANLVIARLRALIEEVEPAPPISTILSRAGYAFDLRAIQAASDQVSPKELTGRYDYSGATAGDPNCAITVDADGAVWVDFVADMGGKFEPGFSLAHLLSFDNLDVEGAGKLPHGTILVTSDGLTSADADRFDYEWSMRRTFGSSSDSGSSPRKLLALPGPYLNPLGEGPAGYFRRIIREFLRIRITQSVLAGFDALFCSARQAQPASIGPWECPQHRSYWAVRLPHNLLLWGIDVPAGSPVDDAQLNYFERIADQTSPVDMIVLYLSAPPWLPGRLTKGAERTLWKIVSVAQKNGAKVGVLIAGGAHLYSRYFCDDLDLHCITAGGATGTLQPTHGLKDKLKLAWPGAGQELSLRVRSENGKQTRKPACWPSKAASYRMSIAILAFPFTNFRFSLGLGVFYWLMAYLLATTRFEVGPWGNRTVSQIFFTDDPTLGWPDVLIVVLMAVTSSLALGTMCLIFWAALFSFADPSLGPRGRVWFATLHWLAHSTMIIVVLFVVSSISVMFTAWLWPSVAPTLSSLDVDPSATVRELLRSLVIFPLWMIFLGAIAAGTVWGLYLFLTGLYMRTHEIEAFEALNIFHYKTFLRMRVSKGQATIYPIGVKTVLRSHELREMSASTADETVKIVPTRPIKPQLIEGPIVIRKKIAD